MQACYGRTVSAAQKSCCCWSYGLSVITAISGTVHVVITVKVSQPSGVATIPKSNWVPLLVAVRNPNHFRSKRHHTEGE